MSVLTLIKIPLRPIHTRREFQLRCHGKERNHRAVWSVEGTLLSTVVGIHWFCVSFLFPDFSFAVLNAPKTQFPRTAVSALRKSIPSFNPELTEIQTQMEKISFFLRIPQRKPWKTMEGNIQEALSLAEDPLRILTGVPEKKMDQGRLKSNELISELEKLRYYVQGEDPGKVSSQLGKVLDVVAEIKLLEAPGLPYLIPRAYAAEPRLIGRAVVDFEIQRKSELGSFSFEVGGGQTAALQIVLDGYSSPLSAGCFAYNVASGQFSQQRLVADRDSIIFQNQNTDGNQSKSLPLEILSVGEFEPLYKEPLDVQTGDLPVLPFSIYGSVSLSHSLESEESSATDQAFIFKFNKATSGLGGMAFDEGKFSVIGYVTNGVEYLKELRTGDIITKAEFKSGKENLILPQNQQ